MQSIIKVLIIVLAGFAVLAPFASSYPDGLEKVAENLKIEAPEPFWEGLMPDYTLPMVENPYLSTLLAGIFGFFLVLATSFILWKIAAKPTK